jgi:hypothetical protein
LHAQLIRVVRVGKVLRMLRVYRLLRVRRLPRILEKIEFFLDKGILQVSTLYVRKWVRVNKSLGRGMPGTYRSSTMSQYIESVL